MGFPFGEVLANLVLIVGVGERAAVDAMLHEVQITHRPNDAAFGNTVGGGNSANVDDVECGGHVVIIPFHFLSYPPGGKRLPEFPK